MNNINPGQLNVSLEKTSPIVCEECSNETFTQGLYLRRVSAILTGTGQEGVVPIPTFVCIKCNHVNEKFRLNILPDLEDDE